ncbi:MAG TPA: pyruvate kinase [Candidatus Thermoplasmatota archaeon]|nr:pyruvate kinase [Candidatus Thermoplasmatota archaeon]
MRRTKILATLGPASTPEPALRALLAAGADAVRLNFSHGQSKEHEDVFARVRRLAQELGRAVPIVQDIQGPKIRVGKLPTPVPLSRGQEVLFRVGEESREPGVLPITYAHLAEDVKPGDSILMADGYLSARVVAVEDRETVRAQIVDGGTLTSNKGVNFPGVRLSIRFPTEKDKHDIQVGQRLGVDYIAVSFVRSAADLAKVRADLDEAVGTRVISKVELREAVDNLDEIIGASDGVMVARGDLGVELPPEDVPIVQKDILLRCDRLGIPSITATQMLESMIENPRPTRAEVTDVYNAVLDGTGAVMLSAETAVGKHANEAVAVMGRICERAESELLRAEGLAQRRHAMTKPEVPDVVAHGAARAAEEVGAAAIVVLTHHGLAARILSKYKPTVPILAVTSRKDTYHRLGLLWGVTAVQSEFREDDWEAVGAARDAVLARRLAKPGDVVVMVNSRAGVRSPANTMRVGALKDFGPTSRSSPQA